MPRGRLSMRKIKEILRLNGKKGSAHVKLPGAATCPLVRSVTAWRGRKSQVYPGPCPKTLTMLRWKPCCSREMPSSPGEITKRSTLPRFTGNSVAQELPCNSCGWNINRSIPKVTSTAAFVNSTSSGAKRRIQFYGRCNNLLLGIGSSSRW